MADPCSSSSSMADPCSSASTSYSQNFQVFINHRGPDAKDTFATPLYRSLTQSGLLVFLDKPEMQVGHDIPSQIKGAILVASLHVAILSPRYAESEWCLNELLLMIESKKTIIPVFYNVKPSDVRWTGEEKNGPYARALYAHETQKRCDPKTIQQWRTALSHVANISGLELEAFNGKEEELRRQQELLGKVVQSVLKIVPPPLDVAKYPTGLGEKLEEFERTVLSEHQREHRVGAKVVGIVGLGGIGKTTLARYFFKLKRSEYNMSSLLFDVRENAAKISLNSLQIKLIKQLKHQDIQIERWEDGTERLKNHLSSCHALIILDDVDHINHLDAFLPIKDVLHPNSLILVTSRDTGVLTSAKIVESSIYHLKGLTIAHSHQLFCSYAFSQLDPLRGYENLVYEFIEKCDRLPLSLKVLGALLCGKNDLSYWKEVLDGLHKLHPDIENRLIVSYNSLNEEEQQIFLDIACFCIGDYRDKWIRIWGGSGWKGLVGFRNLQNKCLVDVDSYNRIRMHDHLRDMGRSLAGSSKSMPRRLWQPIYTLKDINDLLEESSPVITEVRGFRMYHHFGRPNQSRNHSRSHEVLVMRKLQLLEAEGNFVKSILTRVESPKLIWLKWDSCPYTSLQSWIPMHDLRFLEVHGLQLKQLWESERQAPLQLRTLTVYAPLVEFPKSLGQLEHLEKIEAWNTSLEMFPTEFNMPSLKYLMLRGCKFQRLWQSEYGAPLQLRELNIDAPLVEFPKSLGQLQHLKNITATNTFLEMFPKEFNMPSLEYLKLSGCKFQRLWQSEYGAPLQLRELIIDAPLVEFPKSLGQLQHLEKIVVMNMYLEMFPEEFNMPSLKYLELRSCKFQRFWEFDNRAPLLSPTLIIDAPLVEFPKSMGQLHLEKIVARNTSLEMFPKEFNMPSLKYLELRGCKFQRLWQSEYGAPLQLRDLIIDAPLVEFPKSLGQLQHLETIVATNTSLEMFPKEFNMPSLKYLELRGCKLQRLWQSEYKSWELIIDAQLVEFPKSLEQLQHLELEKIVARNTSLEMFPKEFNMPSLKYLALSGCKFQRLWQSEYEAPLQLRELIIDAPLVEFPKSLGQLQHLEKIVARNTSLEMFPKEFNMPSLKYLELRGCKFQRLWQSEYGAPLQLRELIIAAPLVEFPKSLGQLQHLEKIVAKNTSLEMFPKEFNMPSLKYLELSGCKFQRLWQCEYGAPLLLRTLIIDAPLVEFPKSMGQLHLEKIVATNTSLEMFPKEFNMTSLKYLELRRCKFQWLWQSEYEAPLQLRELIIDAPLVEFPMSLGQLKHLERVVAKTSQASLPDFFGNLTNFRCIDLSFCKRLEILPNSFRHLLQLEHLHLKGCCSLTISSETLGNFTELECLDLSGCLHMELLPPQIARQQSLVKLNLLGTILKELPCDLVSLSNLEVLRVGSPALEVLPSSLGSLRNLKQLWLHEYEKLQCLPDSVELLSQLTELKIWKCGIQYLPPAVMKMSNLKVLAVCRCPLRKLPFCPSLELSLELPLDSSINEGMVQLRELQLYRTEVLEVSFPERVCPNLQDLRIVRCEHLVDVGALPTPLRNLDLGYCGELRKIRGIYGVTKLEKLDIRGCNSIEVEELQGLGTLISSGLKLLRSQTEHFDF